MTKTDPTIGKDGKSYPLTHKQEAFVTAYFEPDENGKHRSAADAYRLAYNCKNMSDKTVREAASRLLDNRNVLALLESLKVAKARKTAETVDDAAAEWERLKALAEAQGDVKAAISAETQRQKLKGLLKDHIDQTVRQATPEEHKPDLSSLRQKAALVDDPTAPHLGTAAAPVTESKLTH